MAADDSAPHYLGHRERLKARFRDSGPTALADLKGGEAHNASVARALELGDSIKRIDGSEVAVTTPWLGSGNGA